MAKKESSFLNMTITLLLVTAMASLALAAVYNVTKGPIAAAERAKLNKALSEVLPVFDTIYKTAILADNGKDSLIFYEGFNEEKNVGTALKTFTDLGFSGRITVMVGFLADGTIVDAKVLDHKETPGLGDKMEKEKGDFSNQFRKKNPKTYKLLVQKDGGDVDAITAATISSRAYCDAIQRAYDAYKNRGGDK